MRKAFKIGAYLFASAALPVVVLAAPPGAIPLPTGVPDTIDEIRRNIVCRILGWVFIFAIVFGVFYVLFAAYKYLSSGGSGEAVEQAHMALLFATVGIGVAILASAAPYIVGSIVASGGRGSDGLVRNYCPRT